jgi:hypothetical protein
MKVTIEDAIDVRADPERVFDFIADIANLTTFVGAGPIPAIVGAEYLGGVRSGLGTRRRVLSADGTRHHDLCVLFRPPFEHGTELHDFEPPFSLIIRNARDVFRFAPVGVMTEIRRVFMIELTSLAAYPLALPLLPYVKKAIESNLASIKAGVERASLERASSTTIG